MSGINKSYFFVVLAILFVACEKDDTQPQDNLFASIEVDDNQYYYSLQDSIYSENITILLTSWSNYLGSGFINKSKPTGGFNNPNCDQFFIRFKNIIPDSIEVGNYYFSDVELYWMEPVTWDNLYSLYLESPDYLTCVALNSESVCGDLDMYSIMSSTNVTNESYVEVTKVYSDDDEKLKIVEGKIKGCYIASSIDLSIVKRLKGEFRLRFLQQNY